MDSHQHFWRYNAAHQARMTDDMADRRRDYMSDELRPLLRVIQFDGAIAAPARSALVRISSFMAAGLLNNASLRI